MDFMDFTVDSTESTAHCTALTGDPSLKKNWETLDIVRKGGGGLAMSEVFRKKPDD